MLQLTKTEKICERILMVIFARKLSDKYRKIVIDTDAKTGNRCC